MITEVKIKNYRSILNATVLLSPFTLLIGANGVGKSNFLSLLRQRTGPKHLNYSGHHQEITFINEKREVNKFWNGLLYLFNIELEHQRDLNKEAISQQLINTFKAKDKYLSGNFTLTVEVHEKGNYWTIQCRGSVNRYYSIIKQEEELNVYHQSNDLLPELKNVQIFSIDPTNIGKQEPLTPSPIVHPNGSGAVQVLDSLKTGDREDLFNLIEEKFKEYIPEVEKLSFVPRQNARSLQVREKHFQKPTPLSELSEGTRLVLTILTIIYQENPPTMICFEEIDRDLHPRLFEKIVHLCFDITSKENAPQIIATTHNPYLVDEFKDHEKAVIIVEKEIGKTKFTTLAERLQNLEDDEGPLGTLWYSGFVGGVPQRERR